MAKLTIMLGLPASGKSTYAKSLLEKAGKTVRINKDLLCTMLHFDKFTGKNKAITHETAQALALGFLKKGTSVIVDDTNLNPKTVQSWKTLAKMANAKIEYGDMTHIPLAECIVRDSTREKKVGKDVIVNMALRTGMYELKGPIVICDLDGTLCDTSKRQRFLEGPKKDWKSFFEDIPNDEPRAHVRRALIQAFNGGATIVYVSGRPEKYKQQTLAWLKKHCLNFHATIIMRRDGDNRPDTEVKQDILDTYFPDKEDIACVIDDRPNVIRMWKSNGLIVVDVGDGKEF